MVSKHVFFWKQQSHGKKISSTVFVQKHLKFINLTKSETDKSKGTGE